MFKTLEEAVRATHRACPGMRPFCYREFGASLLIVFIVVSALVWLPLVERFNDKIRRPTESACRSPAVLLILRTFLLPDHLFSGPPSFLSEFLILLTLRARGEADLPSPLLGTSFVPAGIRWAPARTSFLICLFGRPTCCQSKFNKRSHFC